MEDHGGGASSTRLPRVSEQVKIVGKVEMIRKHYKCNYIPLIKLSGLLSKLGEGEGVMVVVDTARFSLESVAALSKAYDAELKVLSSEGDLVSLLVYKPSC
ncbi:MAG TPA: hypothetical protein ENF57_01495 [Candidatus Korarchaeota archaeon]|nr:hypothetical protein [Candidatus Korarchaeota archaeon]